MGAAVALLLGCHFDAALQDYCAVHVEECTCDEGSCCLVEGVRCPGSGCCPGLVCDEEDRCIVPPVRLLDAEPNHLQLAAPDLNVSSPRSTVILTNSGRLATKPLTVAISSGEALRLVYDQCSGRALAYRESCEVRVLLNASRRGDYYGTLWFSEEVEALRVKLAGRVGLPLQLEVAGDGSGSIRVEDTSCEGACEVWVAAEATVWLLAEPAPGSVFVRWEGGCPDTPSCTVLIEEERRFRAVFSTQQKVGGRMAAGSTTP